MEIINIYIIKMDWVTIITAIIAALSGGGLISLLTIREQKKALKIENKDKESDICIKLVNELQDQIEKLNERADKKDARITELEDTNAVLRQQLDEKNTALAKAILLRCTRLACDRRRPPLGYSELSPAELMEEDKIKEQ